jgi:hypothetical protein
MTTLYQVIAVCITVFLILIFKEVRLRFRHNATLLEIEAEDELPEPRGEEDAKMVEAEPSEAY